MLKNKLQKILCIGFILNLIMHVSTMSAQLPEIACFNNYNGNGILESGEYAACADTPSGPFCMLDHIPCTHTETAPECPAGSALNPATDQCESQPQYRCATRNIRYPTQAGCESTCPEQEQCEAVCPAGMTRQDNMCTAPPVCPTGAYDPYTNTCNNQFCPYGDNYECRPFNQGHYCSRLDCVDTNETVLNVGPPEGSGDQLDNGPRDDQNKCLGRIYIFSGRDRRCRNWGATIAFENCCRTDDYLFHLMECDEDEKSLGRVKRDGLCHFVGEYCSQELELPLIDVCVERSRSYCCFGTKLSRIVHEQGRPQLKTFNGWGTPENPNCRGFTPEEFQVLDFSTIDLSEWHSDIKTRAQDEIVNDMQQGITDYYENMGD